ncbi:MAG: NAD-dependent epimerase/dehydratase family protein [Candidatus Limnocylindria bacterium]
MRVVVTGGAGFIGRAIVERLSTRGNAVTALVRDPGRARFLEQDGVTLAESALADVAQITAAARGADAVIHGAGSYRIGIRPSERPAMWDANVGTTERVLGAGVAADVPRIVYISTLNVFGNTHGAVVDDSYRRDLTEGFVSWYDETKYRAHEAAERFAAGGAPIVIVQPGQTYGPHDHSQASEQIERAHGGTLPFIGFADAGLAWVHVHDVAGAIVAAVDRGRIGEAYSLAGDCRRMGEAVELAARIGGRRPPRVRVPTRLLRLIAPLNDRLGGLLGSPPNLAEVIRASDGVTYWASHDKASRELGFAPRSLEHGVADTWGRAAPT